jgi:predicted RNA binding protein YcfA (HicA-like mRNA interferase family)
MGGGPPSMRKPGSQVRGKRGERRLKISTRRWRFKRGMLVSRSKTKRHFSKRSAPIPIKPRTNNRPSPSFSGNACPGSSGGDVINVLRSFASRPVDRTGSHAKLRYEHPTNQNDVRVVSVPLHDRIRTGTLQKIAEQCGANDFHTRCEWISEHR